MKNQCGVCGVYCGQCPNGNGRVQFFAQELKRLVDTVRYDWMNDVVKSFNFSNFRNGIEWFSSHKCPMCPNIRLEEAHCKNKKCAIDKKLENCLLCHEYLTCENTQYHREIYPFVVDHYTRVKEVGLATHLQEEENRAKAGIDLMSHLERTYCKIVTLETETIYNR